MEKFNELEDEIAAMKQQIQVGVSALMSNQRLPEQQKERALPAASEQKPHGAFLWATSRLWATAGT